MNPGVRSARSWLLRCPRRFLGASVLAAMLLLAVLAPGQLSLPEADAVVSADHPTPNIVLIVTDDQRADSVAAMPRVRELLADQGVTYSNGMVPTALCCPSRASILTGLYSHDSQVYGNGDVGGPEFGGWAQFHLRGLEFRTIATALSARGYRTGLFGKYFNYFSTMSPDGYVPPGWDSFVVFTFSKDAYYNYRLSDGSWHGSDPADYSTDVLAARATEFVRATPRDRPLFLMLTPYAPHAPFTPAPRHAPAAPPLPAALLDEGFGAAPALAAPRAQWQQNRQHTEAAAHAVRQGQNATLRAVDDAVGAIVTELDAQDRARDTLFVYMSDNGYLHGEHGIVGKDAPYDGATRIPLLLRWDGHTGRGVVDDRLALNVDIAATLANAAGARMDTDGLDLLGGPTRAGFPLEAIAGYRDRPAYCGWRSERWMYVRYASGQTELFDYASDPSESRNLAGRPEVAQQESRLAALARDGCSPEPPGFDW